MASVDAKGILVQKLVQDEKKLVQDELRSTLPEHG